LIKAVFALRVTPMTTTYSEAQHRLDRVLRFFVVVDVAGICIAAINYAWWFAAVWFAAGCVTDVIRTSASQNVAAASTSEDDEFINENEHVEACAFACKLLRLSNLFAVITLATGFLLGNPWWGALLAATAAWFIGLFAILLLCAPRQNAESAASVILEEPEHDA
jgi:hypothetical protein